MSVINLLNKLVLGSMTTLVVLFPAGSSAYTDMAQRYKGYGRILGVAAIGACGEDARFLFRNAEEKIVHAVQLSFRTKGFERSGLSRNEAWELINRGYSWQIEALYEEALEELRGSKEYLAIQEDGRITSQEVRDFIKAEFRPFFACIETEPLYEVFVLDYIERVTRNLKRAEKERINNRRERYKRRRETIDLVNQIMGVINAALAPPHKTQRVIQSQPMRRRVSDVQNYMIRDELRKMSIESFEDRLDWISSPVNQDTSTPDWTAENEFGETCIENNGDGYCD